MGNDDYFWLRSITRHESDGAALGCSLDARLDMMA
jgi:hypothetical protein